MKAKDTLTRVKFKALVTQLRPDGSDVHVVEAFLPWRDGFSKFPTEMFIRGDEEAKLVAALKKWPADTAIELLLTPGRVKGNKTDDGQFGSYFWNVAGIGGGGVEPDRPDTEDDAPLFEEEGEEHVEPPAQGPSQSHWDVRERIIGASWAIDQGRSAVQYQHPNPDEFPNTMDNSLVEDEYLAEVAKMAQRFLKMRDYLAKQK